MSTLRAPAVKVSYPNSLSLLEYTSVAVPTLTASVTFDHSFSVSRGELFPTKKPGVTSTKNLEIYPRRWSGIASVLKTTNISTAILNVTGHLALIVNNAVIISTGQVGSE